MKYLPLLLLLCSCYREAPAVPKANIELETSLTTFTRSDNIPGCNGSGTIMNSGMDDNKNEDLELDEIDSMSYVCDGKDGDKGDPGNDGEDGEDGQDGENGKDGQDWFDTIEFIDPCGDSEWADEILIKFEYGKILAYFEDGGKKFLTLLEDGKYQTTDKQKCRFEIIDGDYYEL